MVRDDLRGLELERVPGCVPVLDQRHIMAQAVRPARGRIDSVLGLDPRHHQTLGPTLDPQLALSQQHASPGTRVSVTTTVRNVGCGAASGPSVRLYAGMPATGTLLMAGHTSWWARRPARLSAQRRWERVKEWAKALPIEKRKLLRFAIAAAFVWDNTLVAIQPTPALFPLVSRFIEESHCICGDDGIRTRGLGLDRAAC